MVAGAVSSAAKALTEQPRTRCQPTTWAINSSLIPFCKDTKQPVGAAKGAIRWVAHVVS